AAPWFPPDAAITPAGGTVALRMQLKAPRGLKEPVCWSISSFRKILALRPNAPSSRAKTGVRRTWRAMRRLASLISVREIIDSPYGGLFCQKGEYLRLRTPHCLPGRRCSDPRLLGAR